MRDLQSEVVDVVLTNSELVDECATYSLTLRLGARGSIQLVHSRNLLAPRDDGGAQKTMQGNVSTLCSAALKRSLPPQSSFIVPTDDLELKKEWPRHPNASRPPDRF
jgi:hypothetical protein